MWALFETQCKINSSNRSLKTARLVKPTVSGKLFHTLTTLYNQKIYSDITTLVSCFYKHTVSTAQIMGDGVVEWLAHWVCV